MANMCPYGTFTHAIVRGIPETFGKHAGEGRENGDASVDLAKAQRQFGCLTGALRQKVGLQLIEIPPDPELPESWRIEDVAIIQGDTALITRPFKQQRRSEVTVQGIFRLFAILICDINRLIRIDLYRSHKEFYALRK